MSDFKIEGQTISRQIAILQANRPRPDKEQLFDIPLLKTLEEFRGFDNALRQDKRQIKQLVSLSLLEYLFIFVNSYHVIT